MTVLARDRAVRKPVPRGPAGPTGPIPDHQWTGPALAFQNPDGGYETPVNLLGPEGPAGVSQIFETRAIAAASSISAGVNYLFVTGFYASGDGGGAWYKKVSSGGTFDTADGKHWQIAERSVDLRMFGAIPNDNTKGALNASALTEALATGVMVSGEDGTTYYINYLITPANAVGLSGKCTLIGLTIGANLGVFEINGVTNGFTLRGPTIRAPVGMTAATAILVQSASRVRIDDIEASSDAGSTAIGIVSASDVVVTRSHVTAYGTYGILIVSSNDVRLIGNLVEGGIDTENNAISSIGSNARLLYADNIVRNAGTFSFAMGGVNTGVIANNIAQGSRREGIVVSECDRVAVTGNSLYFTNTSIDAGITIVANIANVNDVLVANNLISNCGANAVQVIDTGTDVQLVRVTVTGNHIYNPNANNNTGAAAYVGNGIALIGNANTCSVDGNHIRDNSGQMQYTVAEFALGGDTPSGNQIGLNYGTAGALGRYHVIGANSTAGYPGFVGLPTYTVSSVPSASASGPGAAIFVSNEAGGAVQAFSDGTNWRRVTDRAVIS